MKNDVRLMMYENMGKDRDKPLKLRKVTIGELSEILGEKVKAREQKLKANQRVCEVS